MYNLTKYQKLEFVLQKVKELNITAYDIAKSTSLTEAGIGRILNGTTKNPQENTLNAIIEFLEKKVINTGPKNEVNNNSLSNDDLRELLKCKNETLNLIKEIHSLHDLLRKNNINFVNCFEKIK